MNKKISILFGILLVGLLVLAIFIPTKEEEIKEDLLDIDYQIEGNETSLPYETENPVVALYIKKYGSVMIELYPEIAPNTVRNFISLVRNGFYDHNTFHRLMVGFVLQGGDPTGSGSGGPGYSIKGEFNDNGFNNPLSHEKWVVSMARTSQSYDSAGSQFFICLENASSSLDGGYAAFGKVIDGFDAINRIVGNERVKDRESGQLQNNLILEKALIDLKGKEYPEPDIISE